jgi:hypothetical protein
VVRHGGVVGTGIPKVSLLKWDSLGRCLDDVGEQAQSGIKLAKPLQRLGSL